MRAGPASELMNGSAMLRPQSQHSASTSSGSEVTAVRSSNTMARIAQSESMVLASAVKQGAMKL
jgi:hypothetical protein